jgi:Holliday junction resolvasome RuvABC endonuclease subunit
MLTRVLSLDISASSTGWAFSFGQARGKFEYGLIKTSPKFPTAARLAFFRVELNKVLVQLRPTHVVIEDSFTGMNPKVAKLLAKFSGVAEELCMSIMGDPPHVMATTTVKSFFKVKNKKEMFNVISELLEWEEDKVDYKKHNDLSDAIAQLICYIDNVLGVRKFRFDRDYGYIYEV